MTDLQNEELREPHRKTDDEDANPSELSPVEELAPPEYPEWAKVPEPKPKYGKAPQLKLWFGTSPSNAHRWSNPVMKRRRPVPRRQGPNGAIEYEVAGILAREKERQKRLKDGHNPSANLRQNSGSGVGTKPLGTQEHVGSDLGSDVGTDVGAHDRDRSVVKASVEGVGASSDDDARRRETEADNRERVAAAETRAINAEAECEEAKARKQEAEALRQEKRIRATQRVQELLVPRIEQTLDQPVGQDLSPEELHLVRIDRLNRLGGELIPKALVAGQLVCEDKQLAPKLTEELKAELPDALSLQFPHDLLPRELAYSENEIELIAKHLVRYVEETIEFLLVERGLRPSRIERHL